MSFKVRHGESEANAARGRLPSDTQLSQARRHNGDSFGYPMRHRIHQPTQGITASLYPPGERVGRIGGRQEYVFCLAFAVRYLLPDMWLLIIKTTPNDYVL
jgi:hypothetical protein